MLFGLLVFVVFVLLAEAIAGMLIGVVTGWLASLLTRCGPQGLTKDAFLGAGRFLAGLIGIQLIPWPLNMVSYTLPGGTYVESIEKSYQYPERIALVVAIGLPLLYELHRLERKRQLAKSSISRDLHS